MPKKLSETTYFLKTLNIRRQYQSVRSRREKMPLGAILLLFITLYQRFGCAKLHHFFGRELQWGAG